jgi:hypothetical protein
LVKFTSCLSTFSVRKHLTFISKFKQVAGVQEVLNELNAKTDDQYIELLRFTKHRDEPYAPVSFDAVPEAIQRAIMKTNTAAARTLMDWASDQ